MVVFYLDVHLVACC